MQSSNAKSVIVPSNNVDIFSIMASKLTIQPYKTMHYGKFTIIFISSRYIEILLV